VQFVTHNLDGKARGAIALVIGGVSVVIGKVEVRWDVGGVFHNNKGTDSILSRKKVSHESQNRYINMISINMNSRIQDSNSGTGHRPGFEHQYEESILKFEKLPCMLTNQNHSTLITLICARGVTHASVWALDGPGLRIVAKTLLFFVEASYVSEPFVKLFVPWQAPGVWADWPKILSLVFERKISDSKRPGARPHYLHTLYGCKQAVCVVGPRLRNPPLSRNFVQAE